jgi:hypothetical protein
MKTSADRDFRIVEVKSVTEQLRDLPAGLSFFDRILRHEAKEALEAGGEVYISEKPEGDKNGLFIYDKYEATGTIFTKSKDVFDRFYRLKPSSYIFSEIETPDLPKEIWNLWQLDVNEVTREYRFRYHVGIESNTKEIETFMIRTQPETNRRWIGVALKNGDKCFVVRIGGRIVGMAWMTIVGDIARSHGLYVGDGRLGGRAERRQASAPRARWRHLRSSAAINTTIAASVAPG